MKSAIVALSVVAACSMALAQDDPTKKPEPAPAPPPAADADKPVAPAAKKERKVDPKAAEVLQRHGSLIHLPSQTGIKELAGKGDLEQMGMTIGIDPTWTAEKGFDVGLRIPDQLKEMAEAQGASEDDLKKGLKQQFMTMLGINALFELPGKNWSHFDVAVKQTGDDQVVELTPFDNEADAASRTYVFGKDGLLKSSSISPKVDADNPQAQMMEGMTFDTSWSYEKKGEKSLLTGRTLSIMGQEIDTKFSYFDGPNGSFLLKDATITSPQGEQVIQFHDYTVDGKFVESTKAEEAKPAVAPKAPEKPADKPAEPAPAPTPPAPKDPPK